jgi:DNA replication protein DnaC
MGEHSIDRIQAIVWRQLAERGIRFDGTTCSECGGIGHITLNVPMYVKGDDGKEKIHPAYGRAFHCICQYERIEGGRTKQAISEAGIPLNALHYSFESFVNLTTDRLKRSAYEACCTLAESNILVLNGIERPGAMLHGMYGTGKTGLAMCVVNARARMHQRVRLARWDRFVLEWQSTYGTKQNTVRLLNDLTNADFVLLDDVGNPDAHRGDNPEPLSNDARKIFSMIIEDLKANRTPFIITTNFPPHVFADVVGIRNANRVFEFAHPIEVAGEALRK